MASLTRSSAAIALALVVVFDTTPALARTVDTCLVINNHWATPTQDKQLWVEVEGYPNQFFPLAYNETSALRTSAGQTLRGTNFTLYLYDGNSFVRGAFIEQASNFSNDNRHVVWTYTKADTDFADRWPECSSTGVWLAVVHD